jgi:predicted SprT family Zn-dependent metalloprotease
MAEKSRIVQVRLSEKTLNNIDEIVADLNKKQPHLGWNRSNWIRSILTVALEEMVKKERRRGKKKYVCKTCGKRKTRLEIAHQQTTLFGEMEYFCRICHPDQFYQNEPPPI